MRCIRFWWPWFRDECDECGYRSWHWRGLWYKPKHIDSALVDYIMSTPVFEHSYQDIRDYEGVFQRAAVIQHDEDDVR